MAEARERMTRAQFAQADAFIQLLLHSSSEAGLPIHVVIGLTSLA